MKFWWKVLEANLEVVLAIGILLTGMVFLPYVHAASGQDVEFSLAVTGTGPPPPPPPSAGGGQFIPAPPTPPPVPAFKLVDYAPKSVQADLDTIVTLYGNNFPDQFSVTIEVSDATFVVESGVMRTGTTSGNNLTTKAFVVPAHSLPAGEGTMQLKENNTPITSTLPILFYTRANPLDLRVNILTPNINVTVGSGQSAKVTVKLSNTGATTWDDLIAPLNIGTDKPHDRKSAFIASDWIYSDRPVTISSPTGITTGQVYYSTFTIQAPVVKKTTKYTENFAVVAEGLKWIPKSSFSVHITVTPPPKSALPPTSTIHKPGTKPTKPPAPYTQPNPPSKTAGNVLLLLAIISFLSVWTGF